MKGKKYFIKCCEDLGVDYKKTFIIGEGKVNSENRIIQRNNYLTRKDSCLFLVKCLKDRDLFIVWDLKIKKNLMKSNFSLGAEKLKEVKDNCIVIKDQEYHGWGEETVFVFDSSSVKEFIKKVG